MAQSCLRSLSFEVMELFDYCVRIIFQDDSAYRAPEVIGWGS